jgi:hypothetical protein
MGLIQFLLYFILVIWILRVLLRLFLPILFKQLIKKMQKKAQEAYAPPQEPKRKEGTIQVDHVPPKKKGSKAEQAGEFVDFEEIK